LTPDVQHRICSAIEAGNYYEAACAYGGVTYQTFQNWLARGEAARSGIYFDFLEAVKKAEANAEVTVVAQWRQQIPANWQAARDFLARRFPSRWGPADKHSHEHSGPGGTPIDVEVKHDLLPSPEAVRAYLATVAAGERSGALRPHADGERPVDTAQAPPQAAVVPPQ
jgi:hypothetical protein